jgi:hypothetical protein
MLPAAAVTSMRCRFRVKLHAPPAPPNGSKQQATYCTDLRSCVQYHASNGTSYGWLNTINLINIFIVHGLTLSSKVLLKSLRAPVGFIFGMISILGLTPLFAFACIEIPFRVHEFAVGMAVFAAVPTTLSIGVALVYQVRLPCTELT